MYKNFFQRPASVVAKDLLGKYIQFGGVGGNITEVEAYLGDGTDQASHSFVGKTKRNKSMFLDGGHIYVYLIYGMYYCLNFVTGNSGVGEAVLIRGVHITKGIDLAIKNSGKIKKNIDNKNTNKLSDGPGKLCKCFAITNQLDGTNILKNNIGFSFGDKDHLITPKNIHISKRIGITKSSDLMYNYKLL